MGPRARLCLMVLVLISQLGLIAGCSDDGGPNQKLTLGWQTPWATQGQVVQSLVHTDVLSSRNLDVSLKGFSSGAPLNEAALAGDVDLLMTADQPAAALLANGGKFSIVGRLMYNRVAIYVPPDSKIQSVADLKGARIGVPFGTASQRDALRAVTDAGLDPHSDVEFVNLDITEQAAIVRGGDSGRWGDFGALVGFDPTPAIFEAEGLARTIHVGRVVSLVLASDKLVHDRPDLVQSFMDAYLSAWAYYATHTAQANAWFKEASGLTFEGDKPLNIAASVEPNVKGRDLGDIRITLTDDDITRLQTAADFMFKAGLIKSSVEMASFVNQSFAEGAVRDVGDDDVEAISVTE